MFCVILALWLRIALVGMDVNAHAEKSRAAQPALIGYFPVFSTQANCISGRFSWVRWSLPH